MFYRLNIGWVSRSHEIWVSWRIVIFPSERLLEEWVLIVISRIRDLGFFSFDNFCWRMKKFPEDFEIVIVLFRFGGSYWIYFGVDFYHVRHRIFFKNFVYEGLSLLWKYSTQIFYSDCPGYAFLQVKNFGHCWFATSRYYELIGLGYRNHWNVPLYDVCF